MLEFRRVFWLVARELDTVRLRQWERLHVTLPQLRVLYQIRNFPGVTTGDLSRALGITVSTTSGLVIKLVERGLVDRTVTPEDRRQAPLRLTDAGTEVVGGLSDIGRPFLSLVAAELGDDLGPITAALARLASAAERVRPAAPVDDEDGAGEPAAVSS